jgi:general secretion pathway protein D
MILNVDPYNKAARRMQEAIYNETTAYGRDAYNTARAKMLDEVQRAWEPPVRPFLQGIGSVEPRDSTPEDSGVAINNRKLDQIILPKIEFRDATVREAIEFLRQESVRRDDTNLGGRKGINIVLNLDGAGGGPTGGGIDAGAGAPTIPGLDPQAAPDLGAAPALVGVDPVNTRITVELTNIPLREALKYVTSLGGLKFKVEPFAVLVVPVSRSIEDLITQRFQVRPTFMTTGVGAAPTGSVEDTVAADPTGAGAPTPRSILESQGVPFPPGATASYDPQTSTLVVKNTQQNIDLIEELVRSQEIQKPRQITIESRFVEVSQNDLKELSFDWLLGQFNIGGSAKTFGGGGTPGPLRTDSVSSTEFPFTDPSGNVIGRDLVTGGNRTGVGNLGAISANAIDALLFSTPTGVAPGVFSLAGVFTDPQFQLVIRALDQKKGIDLLSSPKVTTRSGQRAVIEIIREFRYPTEFEAPQIPQEVNLVAGPGATAIPIVAPTTPTTFETRNTGVTLEVEPTVGPDGYTIDLNLIPQVVEFEGFINYGSPINAVDIVRDRAIAVTENVINQPIFSTRKVQTSVTIWDGQTVVLGGLMREDVQKIEDKVPVLGDIPLIGRAFRSSVDQHLKRNLIIFVTATLIDPAGQPILAEPNRDVEMIAPEETEADLGLPGNEALLDYPSGLPLK